MATKKFDPIKKYGKLTVLLADLQFYLQMSQLTIDEISETQQKEGVKVEPYNPIGPARVRHDEAILWVEKLIDVLIDDDKIDPNKLKEYFDTTYNVEEKTTLN